MGVGVGGRAAQRQRRQDAIVEGQFGPLDPGVAGVLELVHAAVVDGDLDLLPLDVVDVEVERRLLVQEGRLLAGLVVPQGVGREGRVAEARRQHEVWTTRPKPAGRPEVDHGVVGDLVAGVDRIGGHALAGGGRRRRVGGRGPRGQEARDRLLIDLMLLAVADAQPDVEAPGDEEVAVAIDGVLPVGARKGGQEGRQPEQRAAWRGEIVEVDQFLGPLEVFIVMGGDAEFLGELLRRGVDVEVEGIAARP